MGRNGGRRKKVTRGACVQCTVLISMRDLACLGKFMLNICAAIMGGGDIICICATPKCLQHSTTHLQTYTYKYVVQHHETRVINVDHGAGWINHVSRVRACVLIPLRHVQIIEIFLFTGKCVRSCQRIGDARLYIDRMRSMRFGARTVGPNESCAPVHKCTQVHYSDGGES